MSKRRPQVKIKQSHDNLCALPDELRESVHEIRAAVAEEPTMPDERTQIAMTEPTQEPVTFPEWQRKYIILNRWVYVGGMSLMCVIGLVVGFIVGRY